MEILVCSLDKINKGNIFGIGNILVWIDVRYWYLKLVIVLYKNLLRKLILFWIVEYIEWSLFDCLLCYIYLLIFDILRNDLLRIV